MVRIALTLVAGLLLLATLPIAACRWQQARDAQSAALAEWTSAKVALDKADSWFEELYVSEAYAAIEHAEDVDRSMEAHRARWEAVWRAFEDARIANDVLGLALSNGRQTEQLRTAARERYCVLRRLVPEAKLAEHRGGCG